MKSRPFVWGTFVWNMADFTSFWRHEGGVPGRNDKGLVTYDRKIKKDAFYFYKANWSDEPMIYITSRRFTERTNAVTDVKIYSNAARRGTVRQRCVPGTARQRRQRRLYLEQHPAEPRRQPNRGPGETNGRPLRDHCVWTLK